MISKFTMYGNTRIKMRRAAMDGNGVYLAILLSIRMVYGGVMAMRERKEWNISLNSGLLR